MNTAPIGAWAFLEDHDLAALARMVQSPWLAPDLGLRVVTSADDMVVAEVLFDEVPVRSGTLLYLEDRGPFEVLDVDRWPSGRVMLALVRWPRAT
jgi:predicted N-acetyltransferase YhbS